MVEEFFTDCLKQKVIILAGRMLISQTDPKDVLSGFKLIETNKEFIKGSRVGRSVSDNIFSIGMAIFETIILKTFL